MDEDTLLTLEEAATHSGYRKRELRALVREGRLPAVRAGKRWQVAVSDLAMLPSRAAAPPAPPPPPVVEEPAVEAQVGQVRDDKASDPVIALIELLRERDHKLTELLEERSQLTGQVGFLLGQLSEREERIQRLEQAALAESAHHSVSVLPARPGPVALIDEWTKPPSPDAGISESESTADRRDAPKTVLREPGAANLWIERSGVAPIAVSDPIAESAPVTAEPPIALPEQVTQPRRGLLGLFRRRASI